ncbi:hypothetical protein DICSQDRAFT_129712 [Dichomitus squalens LYAD-421 SS1]|uniref:DUF8212 domain-containing protein n=1 Tax=Dichomitus squalens (strain LYAD-421) TaxID=732165 RepID=R7SLJ0_DICSQ|nr:uncharacterized protein DICSQDRAFT_129712 [Dichomitus squalens LYAD-421 SS1]EJF57031.1 hypothetical protein DICSQDRAFT_129712 [Dichomitus squalens LYAD-421 SS1]
MARRPMASLPLIPLRSGQTLQRLIPNAWSHGPNGVELWFLVVLSCYRASHVGPHLLARLCWSPCRDSRDNMDNMDGHLILNPGTLRVLTNMNGKRKHMWCETPFPISFHNLVSCGADIRPNLVYMHYPGRLRRALVSSDRGSASTQLKVTMLQWTKTRLQLRGYVAQWGDEDKDTNALTSQSSEHSMEPRVVLHLRKRGGLSLSISWTFSRKKGFMVELEGYYRPNQLGVRGSGRARDLNAGANRVGHFLSLRNFGGLEAVTVYAGLAKHAPNHYYLLFMDIDEYPTLKVSNALRNQLQTAIEIQKSDSVPNDLTSCPREIVSGPWRAADVARYSAPVDQDLHKVSGLPTASKPNREREQTPFEALYHVSELDLQLCLGLHSGFA